MADVLTLPPGRPAVPDDFDLVLEAAQAIGNVGLSAALTPLAWQTARALITRLDLEDMRGPWPEVTTRRMVLADLILAALVRGVHVARGQRWPMPSR